ncbi:hypothetical protein ACTXT7_012305 [Hymenolepis weldensis]
MSSLDDGMQLSRCRCYVHLLNFVVAEIRDLLAPQFKPKMLIEARDLPMRKNKEESNLVSYNWQITRSTKLFLLLIQPSFSDI